MLKIAAVNQDRGISPGRAKGAAVHLAAMRNAFKELGGNVTPMDYPDDEALESALAANHRRQPFDLLYERYALGKNTAARFARKYRIPLVLEVNAPLAEEQSRYRGNSETDADRRADDFLFKNAGCVLAVSEAVAEYARQRGAMQSAIMVCPNGIDNRRFNLQVDAQPVRKQHVPDGAFVLGFHGRERPWHGFEHLVTACHALIERNVPAHLMVVGEGEFESLATLPVDRCSRIGWQAHADMPAYVAAFDVLPLTYQPGTACYFSPLKLMEAMACGVVPVVPDLGDLGKVVEHKRTGLVYPPGNQEALVAMLAGLAVDQSGKKLLGQNAAREAARHSWSAIASAVLQRVCEPGSLAAPGGQ